MTDSYKHQRTNEERSLARSLEYRAKVLPDGHLSCPESVKQQLGLVDGAEVSVTIVSCQAKGMSRETSMPKAETGICGIWDDERSAEDIVRDIHAGRRGFKEIEL